MRDRFPILVFELRSRWFGCDANLVREVVGERSRTPLPGAPPHVPGVFGLHGRAVAVVELGNFLSIPEANTGAKPRSEEECQGRIIVVRVGEMTVGILTDRVDVIIEPTRGELREPRISPQGRLLDFVSGELDLGDRIVTVLDFSRLIRAASVGFSPAALGEPGIRKANAPI